MAGTNDNVTLGYYERAARRERARIVAANSNPLLSRNGRSRFRGGFDGLGLAGPQHKMKSAAG